VALPIVVRKWLASSACLCVATAGCAAPGMSGTNPWNASPFASKAKAKPSDAKPTLHISWAKLQESEGNLTEARKSYSTALQRDPRSVEAIMGLARLDYLAHRVDEAEQGFQKAVKMAPESPVALTALGEFYAEQQRWDDAIPVLNRAMQAAPDEKIYRFQLAVVLAKSGKVEDALPHFAQTVGAAEAHYNVGRILYDQGKVSPSEEQFVLAVMKNPKLEEAQFWLDEVRRERDTKIVIAKDPGAGGNPVAGFSPARGAVAPSSAMTPATAAEPRSGNSSQSREVADAPPNMAGAPANGVGQPFGGAVIQPAGSQVPSAPTNSQSVSPQQIEQMRNQRNANFLPTQP
jgi:Tfp pilus assembly protein PilF